MRYNAKIQKEADVIAQENGFFCANYIGPTDDRLVFEPRYADNKRRMGGLAFFITYKDNKMHFERGTNFCKYADKLRYKHFPKKGKEIFDTYKEMLKCNNFASYEDYGIVNEIVARSWGGGYETPTPLIDIYEALEIAERMDMTIEFFPDESTTERIDGWEYLIRIVPGHLPERRYIIID